MTETRTPTKEEIDAMWPCGCVKRGRSGRMTHLKLHHPSRLKCGRCGATKAAVDAIKIPKAPDAE